MNIFKKFTGAIVAAAVFILLFVACLYYGLRAKSFYMVTPGRTSSGMIDFSKTSVDSLVEDYVNREMDRQIVISGTGAMKFYEWQLARAYDDASQSFDFSSAFSYIDAYLQNTDYLVGDIETTMAGAGKGTDTSIYGYGANKDTNIFNTPEVLAQNLADAGFNMIATANSHAMDSGSNGVVSTIGYLNQAGLTALGTVKTAGDAHYVMQNIHGMQTGFIAYTNAINVEDDAQAGAAQSGDGTQGDTASGDESAQDTSADGTQSSDGQQDTTGDNGQDNSTGDGTQDASAEDGSQDNTAGDSAVQQYALVNYLNHYDENAVAQMCAQVQQMKSEGAEIVVVSLSFESGTSTVADDSEKNLAAQLVAAGADVIFGNNASVPQSIDVFDTTDSEGQAKKAVAIYSMGNLLTAQQYVDGTGNNRDMGMICNVEITKSKTSARVTGLEIIPVYSNWTSDDIVSIPVIEAYENPDNYTNVLDAIYASRVTDAYTTIFPGILQNSGLNYTIEDSKYKISIE